MKVKAKENIGLPLYKKGIKEGEVTEVMTHDRFGNASKKENTWLFTSSDGGYKEYLGKKKYKELQAYEAKAKPKKKKEGDK